MQHSGGGWSANGFFVLCVDWLIDFFEERGKAMCQISVDCKKCDRKKTTAGWIVRRQAKRLCKPRGTRGEDFCLTGISPGGAARNKRPGFARPLFPLHL